MIEEIHQFDRKSKKLSSRTKELYRKHLAVFASWCGQQGIERWDDVTADVVEEYLASRTDWASSTRWTGLCAIRRFIRWKYGEDHPVMAVTMVRKTAPPQRTLNRRQADQLLSMFDTTRPKGIRDLAIVTLALDTGLREEELVSIQLDHVDLEEWVLFVPVKGGNWEPAAFFDYTASCLGHWLGVRSLVADVGVNTLFVSCGGMTPGQPITKDGLRAIFRRFSINSELGLISPHDLRRTFATLAVEAGAPTRAVQVAGRWKHIKMVEHYTRALEARVLHRFSPVNHLMGVKPKVIKER